MPKTPSQKGPPFDIQKAIRSAVRFHKQGTLEKARLLYEAALKADPDNFDALHLLGVLHGQQSRHASSIDLISRALLQNPRSAEAHSNLGVALAALNRQVEAIASFDKALAINPKQPQALASRGITLAKLGQHEEAIASFDKTLAIEPNAAETFYNRGNALRELGRDRDAIASYDQALAIKPDDAQALNNRANALGHLKHYDEAIAGYEKVLAIRPDYAYAFGRAAHCRAQICDWRNLDVINEQIIRDVRAGKPVVDPFAFIAISKNPDDQLRCAARLVKDPYPEILSPLKSNVHYQHDKICVAYLSADFHDHATARLMAELFEQHDRTRFEIFGISFGPDKQSEMRVRLVRAFDRFSDVRKISDEGVAKLVREAEVDIAVDLKGFTGNCRPGIFSYHAAPMQVSYLGYPGTMGAPYIDYIIADANVIPEEEQKYYAEKIVSLPDCYQVNDSKRRISDCTPRRTDVGLPADRFVFCCFNNSYKITPQVFDVWMRLLQRVDKSVLWLLKGSRTTIKNLQCEAAARGVDPSRLVFAARAGLEDHLARHRLADLFLDTLPCNAHTTASDALWAGLPVLTCAGRTFAGRVAGSLLHAVGLPDLVTHTLDDYEALATKLAMDEQLLREVKDRLARNRLTKPLFDTDRFRRHIEAAYTTMWEINQRGEEPRSFSVPPLDQSR